VICTAVITIIAATLAQKNQPGSCCTQGCAPTFIPNTPVRKEIGKKMAATTVSRFISSFIRLEVIQRQASSTEDI
jgi:hypothetical protein